MEKSLVLRAVSEWATLTRHQLTEPMVGSVINRWRTQFRRSTLHSYRDIFHRFLVFIDRLHGTRHAEHTPKVPAAQPRNHSCTYPDFDRILACSPPWLRFFLLACRLLGLRLSEARTLTPRNFNQDTNTLSFDRKQCGSSNLPVPAELAPALKYAAEVNPTAPILVTLGARSNSKQAIYQAWHKAKQKASVDDSLIIHDLRHTAARSLYNHTKDIRLVQQLLGHKNLSSTLYYIGVADPADLREILPAIAPKHQLEQMKPATEVKQ